MLADCADLEAGYYVCVGVPGTPSSPVTTTTTTNTNPQPEQTGIESDCMFISFFKLHNSDSLFKTPDTYFLPIGKNWHKVVSGDSCQKIVDEYGTFTLDQL
jgi:hypothetical protein